MWQFVGIIGVVPVDDVVVGGGGGGGDDNETE